MVGAGIDNPGPGAYDKLLPKLVHESFNKGKKARFGSGLERYNPSIVNKRDEYKPGPGQYRADESVEALDRKQKEMISQTSNLQSKVGRFPQLKTDAPPPGRYEPQRYNEIGGGKIQEQS